MIRSFQKIWRETLLSALCFIVLGCFLLINPSTTLSFFSYIVGALVLMLAVLAFYRHYQLKRSFSVDLAYGIVCVGGALVLFFNQTILEYVIPLVIAVVMLANAVFKIPYLFDLNKKGVDKWYISLILAAVKIILAIVLFIDPFASLSITLLIGVCSILFAICDIFDLILIKVWLNKSINEDDTVETPVASEAIEDVEVKEIEDNE